MELYLFIGKKAKKSGDRRPGQEGMDEVDQVDEVDMSWRLTF
jgi:hypothetical protein